MNINVNHLPYFRYLRFVIFVFMFLNLLWLNFLVYKSKAYENPQISIQTKELSNNKKSEIPEELSKEVSKIYEAIREATASAKVSSPASTLTTGTSLEQSSVREFFVPLGSGTNNTDEWTDIPGAQAYIDRSQYTSIKSVVFEASVHIPTGNQIAWVRLFNASDKHAVWLSEMSHEGGEAKLLVSKPIALEPGNKLYQVQMKNQLKDKANLVQSRVRITTY